MADNEVTITGTVSTSEERKAWFQELLDSELDMQPGQPGISIIYTIRKTQFAANDFPCVLVANSEPEPHICVYCKQPVKQGRCWCV